jgi:hypothetical protein
MFSLRIVSSVPPFGDSDPVDSGFGQLVVGLYGILERRFPVRRGGGIRGAQDCQDSTGDEVHSGSRHIGRIPFVLGFGWTHTGPLYG